MTTIMNADTSKLYVFTELLEIIAAAVLAIALVPPAMTRTTVGVLAFVLVFAAAVAFRDRAAELDLESKNKSEAEAKNQEAAKKAARYAMSSDVLETLRAANAEEDVLKRLMQDEYPPPATEEQFVKWLERELGPARAQEKRELILKYARVV